MQNSSYKTKYPHLLNPGHTACAGCGLIIAMRHVVDAAGPNTIIVNATGCSEVTTSQYPTGSYKVPWIHSVFENCASVASGVLAGLKQKGLEDKVNVIAQGGDGATFDIGTGLLSGMFARQENILYVCFDNEGYMNTGYQSSGSTNIGTSTTTSPSGKKSTGNDVIKKDMLAFALAHKCVYVASATVGNVLDIDVKVKKALELKGPKYIQILVPCVPGWKTEPMFTIKIARLAQQSGHYPVVEYINGEITNVMKVKDTRPKVKEYLEYQRRFKHLFKTEQGKKVIEKLQKIADENVLKYNLL